MKIKYEVTFLGEPSQSFTVDNYTFKSGKTYRFDKLPSRVLEQKSCLKIEKVVVKKEGEKISEGLLKDASIILEKDLPKKYFVTFIGSGSERFILCLDGYKYLKRMVKRETTKKEADEIRKLGGEFKIEEIPIY